jgi:hypothetical protein
MSGTNWVVSKGVMVLPTCLRFFGLVPSSAFKMENDFAGSGCPSMFKQKNTLVTAQKQVAIANWDGKVRLRERALDVGWHVISALSDVPVKRSVFR